MERTGSSRKEAPPRGRPGGAQAVAARENPGEERQPPNNRGSLCAVLCAVTRRARPSLEQSRRGCRRWRLHGRGLCNAQTDVCLRRSSRNRKTCDEGSEGKIKFGSLPSRCHQFQDTFSTSANRQRHRYRLLLRARTSRTRADAALCRINVLETGMASRKRGRGVRRHGPALTLRLPS
jgi:hypothetical protein